MATLTGAAGETAAAQVVASASFRHRPGRGGSAGCCTGTCFLSGTSWGFCTVVVGRVGGGFFALGAAGVPAFERSFGAALALNSSDFGACGGGAWAGAGAGGFAGAGSGEGGKTNSHIQSANAATLLKFSRHNGQPGSADLSFHTTAQA